MRVVQYAITEVDQYIEEAQRAKNHLDSERWRAELRPRAMQLFASRAARLTWSRALVNAVVEALYPDDLFPELIGTMRDRTDSRDSRDVSGCASHERDRSRSSHADTLPTITVPILWLASAPSRLFASLRPREAGLTALTGHSVEPCLGSHVMVGPLYGSFQKGA